MRGKSSLGFALLAVVAVVPACGGGGGGVTSGCSELACVDQFQANVMNPDGTLPSGMHVLELTADGTTSTCSYTITADPGSQAMPACARPISIFIMQASSCTTGQGGATTSTQCTPLPGMFWEAIRLEGHPASVHATLTVDGTVRLDGDATPTYATTQPNGPGCPPTCEQATVSWGLSPPPT
jgi:hypothetical protein